MLPLWIQGILIDLAAHRLRGGSYKSPLGGQLAKAELFARCLHPCYLCDGTGYRRTITPDPLLPPEELGACRRCSGSGQLLRTRDKAERSGNPWPYMYVKPTESEPSYEFAEPPCLGPQGIRVRRALDRLDPAHTVTLYNFYASLVDWTPEDKDLPLISLVPLNKRHPSGLTAPSSELQAAQVRLDSAMAALEEALLWPIC